MHCPHCSTENVENARFCQRCGKELADGAAAPIAGGETSGKATASLVLGLFFWLGIPAIAAIILGHKALAEIRRSAGRLTGEGRAVAGLVLGYLGSTVPIILIVAAIAIPNLLKAKQAANQASAVASLRTISVAEVQYSSSYNTFSPTLAALGPAAQGSAGADAAGLIDAGLASGAKSGYLFTYQPQIAADGVAAGYVVHADPLQPGVSGTVHYFIDSSTVIRERSDGPANQSSSVLDR